MFNDHFRVLFIFFLFFFSWMFCLFRCAHHSFIQWKWCSSYYVGSYIEVVVVAVIFIPWKEASMRRCAVCSVHVWLTGNFCEFKWRKEKIREKRNLERKELNCMCFMYISMFIFSLASIDFHFDMIPFLHFHHIPSVSFLYLNLIFFARRALSARRKKPRARRK